MGKPLKSLDIKEAGYVDGRRILIVDDDRDFSVGLGDLLTLEGYAVKLTHSADEVEEALKHFPAEVALIDLRLGQDSGIELISSLQSQHPQLLCVMMTAYADLDTAVTALRHGAYDYLRKPFHSEDMLATLHRSFGNIDLLQGKAQAEEALRRSQKMEAIGQLSGGIAHDFNNQLGIIIGYLDFLKDYAANDDKPSKWIDTATRAANRCIDLTRQLLVFSRRQAREKTVVNLNATIKELETMIARSVTPEVEVQYFLADDPWQTEINLGEFQDALLNLVINARDAMPGGGKLLIETSNKHLDEGYATLNPGVEAGDYVQLMLSDTGTGMDKETLEHVFEPFFTTKPEGKGTGLGMAMVYGFVNRYGGHIKMYSEPGVGTTMRLYLPRSTASESAAIAENAQATELPTGNESILIVDDEVDLLQLADRYLSDLGYRIRCAENAAQALEKLAGDETFDLLFSDVVMPGGMNGYELAQKANEMRPGLKVLLTSGFTAKSVANNGLARFSAHLLNKPYRREDLAQRIRLVLDEALDEKSAT